MGEIQTEIEIETNHRLIFGIDCMTYLGDHMGHGFVVLIELALLVLHFLLLAVHLLHFLVCRAGRLLAVTVGAGATSRTAS